MQIGPLTIDPLAVGALVGFGALVLVMSGITIWLLRQMAKRPGEK
ncbi:hypothetical protein [Hyphomonas sediminis]|nr:hypothetical protein [Hyphomonas sediminis]